MKTLRYHLLHFHQRLPFTGRFRRTEFSALPKRNANTVHTIARFEFFEHVRNKWLIGYSAAFFAFSSLIIHLGGNNPLQAAGSLLSLVLLLVPLFSLIFGTITFTDSLPFMEILAAQPILRRNIYIGKWLGLSVGLSLAFVIGLGSGSLFRLDATGHGWASWTLLVALGALLSFVFVAIAFLLSNLSVRHEVVFASALGAWFFFFIAHDLILFGLVSSFGDYPLEWAIFALSLLNPIDLVRIVITLQMDISSMMGATGAVMNRFLGGTNGILLGIFVLLLWVALPLLAGIRIFDRRNL